MLCPKTHSDKLEQERARRLSLEGMKALHPKMKVYIYAHCGCLLGVRVNGVPQVWKTRPDEVRVPAKFGLYGYVQLRQYDEVFVPKGD